MEYMLGVFKRSSDIMRNHDDGNPFLSIEFFNKSIHFCRNLRIQSGNRFYPRKSFLRGTELGQEVHAAAVRRKVPDSCTGLNYLSEASAYSQRQDVFLLCCKMDVGHIPGIRETISLTDAGKSFQPASAAANIQFHSFPTRLPKVLFRQSVEAGRVVFS